MMFSLFLSLAQHEPVKSWSLTFPLTDYEMQSGPCNVHLKASLSLSQRIGVGWQSGPPPLAEMVVGGLDRFRPRTGLETMTARSACRPKSPSDRWRLLLRACQIIREVSSVASRAEAARQFAYHLSTADRNTQR